MKICTLVKSCKADIALWNKIFIDHPTDIFIYYGDLSIDECFIDGFNIVLKCNDSWGGLMDKQARLYSFLDKNIELSKYTHFFIIDTREAFHNAFEMNQTLRDLEKTFEEESSKDKHISNINISVNNSFTKKYNLDNFNYTSDFIHNSKSLNDSLRTSYYHIGKNCGLDKPLNGPKFPFNSGSGTLFSKKSVKILTKFLAENSNKEELYSVFRNFAEDVTAAYILRKNCIYPSTYPFNIHMRNYDVYFPELASKFEDLYINNIEVFTRYQEKFRSIQIIKNESISNDLGRFYSLKKILNELQIEHISPDNMFTNLMINIYEGDIKKFEHTVHIIIQNNLFKKNTHNGILIHLARTAIKNAEVSFYQPMIDLLDEYFIEFNLKYFLEVKLCINNANYRGLYKILKKIHNRNYVDLQNIKNRIINYLIFNDFNIILFKYLHPNSEDFLSKITVINYEIKLERYDNALSLINNLQTNSDSELFKKNSILFKLAKKLKKPDLCVTIIDSLNCDDQRDVELKKSILSFVN